MLILRNVPTTDYFENLVIEQKSDTINAYVVKYTPSSTSNLFDGGFDGTIEASKVYGQTCIVCPGSGESGSDGDGGGFSGLGGGGGTPTDGVICTTVFKCNIFDPAHPNLPMPHISYSTGCEQIPFVTCTGTASSSSLTSSGASTGSNTGPGNGGLHGGSGSNSGATTPNNNPIVLPVLPTLEQTINNFVLSLSPQQQLWWNNPINSDCVNQIKAFLSKDFPKIALEDFEFAENIMNYLINNSTMSWEILMNSRTSFDTNEGEVDNYSSGGYDTTTYTTFNPLQQIWTTIPKVIPQNKFVGWNRVLHPDWHCMDYSKEQLRVMGYQISSYFSIGQTFQIYTAQNGVNNDMLFQGLSYIKYALSNGIPVIVGVDDAVGHTGNLDSTTDHFIVIVGMGTDTIGKYFQFYDNASGIVSQGASSLNKLYYNSTTGIISGSSQCINYVNTTEYPYRVTMIRKSKSL